MENSPDHAPFYFSHRNKPVAQDADDPTVKEVLASGSPTGETGRKERTMNESIASKTTEDAKKKSGGGTWRPVRTARR
jgi:hypothetical protein